MFNKLLLAIAKIKDVVIDNVLHLKKNLHSIIIITKWYNPA